MTVVLLTALFVLVSFAALMMASISLLRRLRTGSSSDILATSLIVVSLSSLWGVASLGEELDTGQPILWGLALLLTGAVSRTIYVHRAGGNVGSVSDRTSTLLALSSLALTAVAFGGDTPTAILPSIAGGIALVSVGASTVVAVQERNCWAAGAALLAVVAAFAAFASFNLRLLGVFYGGGELRLHAADIAYIPLGISTLLACHAGVRHSGSRLIAAAILLAGSILWYLA